MALWKSHLLSDIRGSINGTVFARNRGGAYARNRTVPIQPGGQLQQVTRQAVSVLSSRWRDTLTPGQRDGWDAYALATPIPNSLGDPRNVGGLGMYVRGNAIRVQAGLPVVDNAPTAGFPTIGLVFASSFAAGVLIVEFDASQPWVDEDGSHLVVFASRPVSQAVNFFKGPYRRAGIIDGDSTTAPTSPQNVNYPFGQSVQAGSRIFTRAVVISADGRASDSSFASVDVN